MWKIGDSKDYSVRETYIYLQSNSPRFIAYQDRSNLFRKFWTCCAPSKVLAFSWKLLLNRLSTYLNLLKRNAFPGTHPCVCVLYVIEQEYACHLFLQCSFTTQVWYFIYRWLDFPFVLPIDNVSHYLQQRGILNVKRLKRLGA